MHTFLSSPKLPHRIYTTRLDEFGASVEIEFEFHAQDAAEL